VAQDYKRKEEEEKKQKREHSLKEE